MDERKIQKLSLSGDINLWEREIMFWRNRHVFFQFPLVNRITNLTIKGSSFCFWPITTSRVMIVKTVSYESKIKHYCVINHHYITITMNHVNVNYGCTILKEQGSASFKESACGACAAVGTMGGSREPSSPKEIAELLSTWCGLRMLRIDKSWLTS